MRILVLLTLLLTGTAWSATESRCHQVDGIYKNSPESLDDLKFESLVDIFSFNNAKNLVVRIAGKEMKFVRTSIDVTRNTKMTFVMLGNHMSRSAIVEMDRTPNLALKTKLFYGNLIVNSPITEWAGFEVQKSMMPKVLTYNFYCTF